MKRGRWGFWGVDWSHAEGLRIFSKASIYFQKGTKHYQKAHVTLLILYSILGESDMFQHLFKCYLRQSEFLMCLQMHSFYSMF